MLLKTVLEAEAGGGSLEAVASQALSPHIWTPAFATRNAGLERETLGVCGCKPTGGCGLAHLSAGARVGRRSSERPFVGSRVLYIIPSRARSHEAVTTGSLHTYFYPQPSGPDRAAQAALYRLFELRRRINLEKEEKEKDKNKEDEES